MTIQSEFDRCYEYQTLTRTAIQAVIRDARERLVAYLAG